MAKKILKGAVMGVVVAAMGLSATAAQAASQQGIAKARILRELRVENTADLQFGTIISGASADTIDVSTSGTATCGTNLTCSGTTTAAAFDVYGTNNAVVLVSGDNSVTLNNTTTSGFTMTASLNRSTSSLTLTAGPGSVGGSFTVGGTLSIGSNQEPGVYEGTFNVTADYQ
jgi:hypothetical protein